VENNERGGGLTMEIKKLLLNWVLPIGMAIVVAVLVNQFVFFNVSIPSESMVPTLKVGDTVFATRVYDKSCLNRGDIVVFYSHELKITLIKRLVGLPGDQVEIRENGEMYINGEKYNEPYVVYRDNFEKKFSVPEGKYLFMGDNRPVSWDGRKWDDPYIDGKDIQGKAQFILFPFNRFGKFVEGQDALKR
jgi:signal peptidase I